VLQQKGGSGKTTLAVNLAAAAHLEGRRTLVVDMDRQASAFDWSAARQEGSSLEGLAVVKADRAIALPRFREISRGYEFVFLDGPPRLGDVTQSAAVAADVAVLPLRQIQVLRHLPDRPVADLAEAHRFGLELRGERAPSTSSFSLRHRTLLAHLRAIGGVHGSG
jgi:cellulose biosynthesis protein BcsQ